MASPMVQIQVTAPVSDAHKTVLTAEAVEFLKKLASTFEDRRQQLLATRHERQARIDKGELPDFLPETANIRKAEWTVASIPADLMDRRVEITGPVDRKMIINALNCGAEVFMADFEDSNSPTWTNNLDGHVNLRDAINRTITYTSPEGKSYKLNEKTATLLVRPRGWHLDEKHFLVDGKPISGALFDFGLFFFHNAKNQIARGTAPYFYLPKLESHQEARLWNDVFNFSQDYLGIPRGTIRATVLIETILAAFEMDEILYELKEHSSGLNCGRWDYIFSFIKKFSKRPDFVLPNRAEVTMTQHFLASYVALLIEICHRRGAHAMGGMAAQIPIKNDPEANEKALAKVREDKLREVKAGHDGTWVAHPGLVSVAKDIFNEYMKTPNQINVKREKVNVTAKDLLAIPKGNLTMEGLKWNIDVGLQYLASWLNGNGCVPIYNLMEDAATAEISRAQDWQWVKHRVKLQSGETVTPELVREATAGILDNMKAKMGEEKFKASKLPEAGKILVQLMTSTDFHEFLTLDAYAALA
ncbi:MAG TPA: malate synthase A [Candidatus Acidoferrales bacterium]|nr:malate synthase A [Candidatus Acidoferrales bacterium]